MSEKKHADIEKLSFEQGLKELEEIVRKLESGGQELEKSIEYYARGSELKNHCEKKLSEAKLKVEKIVSGAGGKISTEKISEES